MSKTNDNIDFIEFKKSSMEFGFWDENYKSVLIIMMESHYQRHIIREWAIIDVMIHGDKVLLKWTKRIFPLTEKELDKKYER